MEEETHRDSPAVEAAAKELMRLYPHLDALMASTIAWYELKKNLLRGKEDAGAEDKTVVS